MSQISIKEVFRNRGGPRQVLVIDDDDSFRSALREVLEDWGYMVDSASSPAEAMKLLHHESYHAVVTDTHFEGSKTSGDDFLLQHQELIQGATKIAITGREPQGVKRLSELRSLGIPILQKGDSQFRSDLRS